MACDIKYAMFCWQDQYGSENAKANVFVDGVQVLTEVEITATSDSSPQCVTFEVTNQTDLGSGRSADIKVVLTNEAYVDADNDRNIWINGLYAVDKATGSADYSSWTSENGYAVISDWTATGNFIHTGNVVPSAVSGSQIASDWWAGALAASSGGSFWHIPVWGDDSDVGTTITMPLERTYQQL